jgi:hypothetical protein
VADQQPPAEEQFLTIVPKAVHTYQERGIFRLYMNSYYEIIV